jgi:cyclic pyranopterin phosphate synthase
MGSIQTNHFDSNAVLQDSYGRQFRYLRLSLTEACNMACTYCLPDGFPEWYRHKARLDLRDIQVILEGFRSLGFKKVRFTGGEPTIHPQCIQSIQTAKSLGYEQIALTTNGLNISSIEKWVESGLTQINISCDSFNPTIFENITQSKKLHRVMDLIEQALKHQLIVKINTVLMRSKNGSREHISEMIHWALQRPLVLRFIELMNTGLNHQFASAERIYGYEVRNILSDLYPNENLLEGTQSSATGGPAVELSVRGYPGKIGFINPLSCNFCNSCNRLRITAKGRLKLCLFGDHDYELNLKSPEELAHDVRRLLNFKGERHHLESGQMGNVETFRTIGG